MSAFASLIDPVEPERFASDWRDTGVLHVERRDSRHFAHLVDAQRIEQLLSERTLSFPDVQLSRAAAPIAAEDYTDAAGRIVPARLLALHAQGGTIVLARAQAHFAELAGLCRQLQRELGVRCQANVYLSPPGQQGFGPHYDAHDVFILQVAGRKRFAFYAGGPDLPLSSQPFEPSLWPAGERRDERMMEAGGTLYIPRGVMHDAIADTASASLHVTLGTFAPSAFDVLQRALQRCADRDVRLRRALHEGDEFSLRALADLLPGLLDPVMLDRALGGLRDEVALATLPDVQGLGAQLAELPATGERSRLRLRDGEPWLSTRHGDTLTLRCTGSLLNVSGPMVDAVERLLQHRCVTLSQWTTLEPAQRTTLAQRLVASGVARFEGTGEAGNVGAADPPDA